jgi:hypothetical protein
MQVSELSAVETNDLMIWQVDLSRQARTTRRLRNGIISCEEGTSDSEAPHGWQKDEDNAQAAGEDVDR